MSIAEGPKGHADDCCTEALEEDIVDFQDAREGEVWETVRERIVGDMPNYGFTRVQVNTVLGILDLEFLTPEEAK